MKLSKFYCLFIHFDLDPVILPLDLKNVEKTRPLNMSNKEKAKLTARVDGEFIPKPKR